MIVQSTQNIIPFRIKIQFEKYCGILANAVDVT